MRLSAIKRLTYARIYGNITMDVEKTSQIYIGRDTHYNGAEIEVKRQDALPDSPLMMGEVAVELETTPYIDYTSIIPQEFDTEVIIDTKSWIKPIRQHKPESIGIIYSSTGCLMYLRSYSGETVSCEPLPVQMFNGPDKKVAYQADRFRRALTSCGPGATIEVGDPAKPTLFETDDYWHILMPYGVFPNEVSITGAQREAIKWAEEALEAVRKGDVPGLVLIGGGKFYLELSAARALTDIRVEEPKLANAPAPVVETPNTSQEAGDDDGQQ